MLYLEDEKVILKDKNSSFELKIGFKTKKEVEETIECLKPLDDVLNKYYRLKNEIMNELNYLENKAIDNPVNTGRIHALQDLQEVLCDDSAPSTINYCENCHHYNSLINWEEGVFHQCMLKNNLWEKCDDYDPIKFINITDDEYVIK